MHLLGRGVQWSGAYFLLMTMSFARLEVARLEVARLEVARLEGARLEGAEDGSLPDFFRVAC